MRIHPLKSRRIVFCVGPARLVRELSPLLENAARVRWAADLPALGRAIGHGAAAGHTAINDPCEETDAQACVVEDPDMDRLACMLETIRQHHPRARRLAIVNACDMHVLRRFIESELTHGVIYRPFELHEIRRALSFPVLTGAGAPLAMAEPRG